MRKNYAKVTNLKLKQRLKRKLTIRKKISGTSERLRLVVAKSNANITVQAVDDSCSKSLFTVSTFGKSAVGTGCNKNSAKLVGAKVATELKNRKLSAAVFDSARHQYTRVLATLVHSLRAPGINV